jgi:hypothetical protein
MIEKIILSILILILPGIILSLILFNRKEITIIEFYSLSQALSIATLAFITSILLFMNILINIYIIYALISVFIIIIFILKYFLKLKVKLIFDKYQLLALIFLLVPISYYILYFYSEPYFSLTFSGDPYYYVLHYKTLYEGDIISYYANRLSIFAPALFLVSFPLDIPFSFISIRYLTAYFDILTGLMIYSATLVSTKNKKWALIALLCFNIILFVNYSAYFVSGLFANILANFLSFALIYLIFYLKEENLKSYFFLTILTLTVLAMHISVGLLFIALLIYFLLTFRKKAFALPTKNSLAVIVPFLILTILGFTVIKTGEIPLLVYFFQYALGETGFFVVTPGDQTGDSFSYIINNYFRFLIPYISIASQYFLLLYPLIIIPFISFKFYKEKYISFNLIWFFIILIFSNIFFGQYYRFSYQLYLPTVILLSFFIYKAFDKFSDFISNIKLFKKPIYALSLIFLIIVSISTGISMGVKFGYQVSVLKAFNSYENSIFNAMNYIKENFSDYTVISTATSMEYLTFYYNIKVVSGIFKPQDLNYTGKFIVVISEKEYYFQHDNSTEKLDLVLEYEKAGFRKVYENEHVVIFLPP